MAARILVCDDERSIREMLSVLFRRGGYDADIVDGVVAAREAIASAEQPYDLVVTDLVMPDGSGMEVLETARARDPSTQVVMITAYATTEQAVKAMRLGAYDYVQKPFRNDELRATVDKALEKRAIVDENRRLRETLEGSAGGGLIGTSAAMRRVVEMVERVANAPASVLITGESGTGKEMVARELHTRSSRAGSGFVPVNCGALPESLMESELFGYEKGAFTGATKAQEGLVRAADGGTLFLDEIGELAPNLQVKLLRVLQERRVRPVGAQREIEVDVRVVAATNRDVESEVAEGRLRQDLFYRLNVVRIHIPPLRERVDDIPALAEHFLRKHSALHGKRLTIAPEAMRWLTTQGWPGNVRELENTIERGVTFARGSAVELEDLSSTSPPASDDPLGAVDLSDGTFDLDGYLGDVERRLLVRALDAAGGVRTEAARLLGVTFRSLRYRLAKYELGEEDDSRSGG